MVEIAADIQARTQPTGSFVADTINTQPFDPQLTYAVRLVLLMLDAS